MRDTTPEAAEVQAAIHRQLGGVGRLMIALEMSRLAQELAKARIRCLHPDYTEQEVIRARVAELLALGQHRESPR